MATKILLKKSLTGGSVPVAGDIDAGEIAINLVDRKVYSKDGAGAVIRMDGAFVDSTAPSNPVEGDIWYDTANNLLKAHNGTGFVSAGYQTIAALEDTTITSVADGEFLVYNTAAGKWINETHAEADVQKVSTLESDVEALFSVTDAGGDGSLAYSAGVFTYTGPSAAEAQAHFSGGNGISLTSGAIALDFTEFNTGDITEVTNLFYTDERVDDRVGSLIVGGTNITSTYNDTAGTLTVDLDNTGGFDLANNDTDDLTEGTTNKYFSNTLVRGAVSVTDAGGDGSLAYNNTSGVFTYTGPSAAEAQAHFSGGTGVTITNGSIAIGQDVATTANVTFAEVITPVIDGNGTSITLDPSANGDNLGTVIVAGNLTVNGTTTTVNSNEVNIGDAIVVLNADETGVPSQDGGIEIERGTSANKVFKWNETDDAWDLSNETMQNISLDGGTY
jgi:hypothetical protein